MMMSLFGIVVMVVGIVLLALWGGHSVVACIGAAGVFVGWFLLAWGIDTWWHRKPGRWP